jgi:hypothetical protein
VQVGGSGRRFDTSHCVGSPLWRAAVVLLYIDILCAWDRGLSWSAAASSSVERWMTSGLVHKGWHQAQCPDAVLSSFVELSVCASSFMSPCARHVYSSSSSPLMG